MDTLDSIKQPEQKIKKLSDSEVDVIWAQFVNDKKNKLHRDKLIIQYIYLIKYVVGRLRINLPATISTDDIAGYGVEGLIDAIERFVPSRGVRFETYAVMRIRGSIIDKIRSQDWVPRGTRRKYKKIQNAILKLQVSLGRMPTSQEIAVELETTKEKVEASINEMESNNIISLHDRRDSSSEGSLEIIDTIVDTKSTDPLQELEANDVKKSLSMALSKLPERERMILALYYHENMTLKEIGVAISISESRVCQLHAQAIMKLRKLLNNKDLRLRK
ncbi:MAG: FliA/WhiG family RNA polymerase sigma factor [Candidatus Gastranaerophilales bacterium]|nr:FliA/WhiG family RNA polymerase sigma factor [Candidatus Gastranaerophilales bacterium]